MKTSFVCMAALTYATQALAGWLNITTPENRLTYAPNALEINWDIRSDANVTLEDFKNLTVALWYLPWSAAAPPAGAQPYYMLEIVSNARLGPNLSDS